MSLRSSDPPDMSDEDLLVSVAIRVYRRQSRQPEALTLIACEECGRMFNLRPRAVRALRAGQRSARCERCIYGMTLVVTDEERLFWLERFSVGELIAIAVDCWGPIETWDSSWRDGFTFTIPGEVAA